MNMILGECVSGCTAKAHEYLAKCTASGEDPEVCAEKARRILRDCIDRCRKQCEAECEEARQLEYQRCVDAGNPPWKCARSTNAAAERCKAKCRGPIMH